MFSVFAVLISSILARVLSSPFERVKVIIDSYMNGKEINTTQVRKTGSNVYEFELLENFLTRSFEVLKEKNKAQLELFNCATQVAHDIRSPLAALDMISKLLTELPEEKRVIIRNAVQRINDIANNLLETHRLKGKSKPAEIIEDTKPELVSSLLDSLTLEKRIQLAHKSINLILEIQNAAYSSFINLEAREFKRVISNLINNASEAIHGTDGVIRLTLEKESNMLIIKIIDNGKGIPADLLPKIKQGGMSIGKKKGAGLGISGAIQNIKKWNGTYDIQSKEGEGTTFIIKLPITEAPDWFQNRLDITLGMNIIVLDDDQSIHDVWETRFQEYIKNGQISLEHFYLPSEFVKYCEVLATPTCPAEAESEGGSYAKAGINLPSTKTLFLIDYELLGSEETGLDLIEKLKLKDHAILVTSRYEEPKIRDKIINLGIKAIPKNFAPYIIINY
jgi:signal transduction histidine kinase